MPNFIIIARKKQYPTITILFLILITKEKDK